MKSVSAGIGGARNGLCVKGQSLQCGVYQAGKSDLGAEGNEVSLKGLNK